MTFEPSREQMAKVEDLALRNASIRCDPLVEADGNLTVQVTQFPERMGYTTRAPRVYDLTISPDGRILMGVLADSTLNR